MRHLARAVLLFTPLALLLHCAHESSTVIVDDDRDAGHARAGDGGHVPIGQPTPDETADAAASLDAQSIDAPSVDAHPDVSAPPDAAPDTSTPSTPGPFCTALLTCCPHLDLFSSAGCTALANKHNETLCAGGIASFNCIHWQDDAGTVPKLGPSCHALAECCTSNSGIQVEHACAVDVGDADELTCTMDLKTYRAMGECP